MKRYRLKLFTDGDFIALMIVKKWVTDGWNEEERYRIFLFNKKTKKIVI